MKRMEEIRNNKGNDRRVRELTVAGFNLEKEGSIPIGCYRMRSTSFLLVRILREESASVIQRERYQRERKQNLTPAKIGRP
jgi:hypothetical protein